MSLHSVKMHPRCLKQSAMQSQVSMNPQCCPLGRMHCHFFMEYSATSLHKVLRSADVSSLNPVLVECRSSGKLFYAIAHKVTGTGCLVVDFEPVKPSEISTAVAWALPQSYMLESWLSGI